MMTILTTLMNTAKLILVTKASDATKSLCTPQEKSPIDLVLSLDLYDSHDWTGSPWIGSGAKWQLAFMCMKTNEPIWATPRSAMVSAGT